MKRTLAITLQAVALLLVAAACDDSGEPDRNPAPSVTSATEATASATPQPAASAVASRTSDELSYIADGAIWLADGASPPRRFADAAACGHGSQLQWSPTGRRLACTSHYEPFRIAAWDDEGRLLTTVEPPDPRFFLSWAPSGDAQLYSIGGQTYIVDSSGATVAEFSDMDLGASFHSDPVDTFWSATGDRLAYWSTTTNEARVYSPHEGTSEPLPMPGHPIAWVLNDTALLMATNYVPAGENLVPARFEAYLFTLSTGRIERRPELDNATELWLSPDRSVAAFLSPAGGLALIHLAGGEVTPIPGSRISYPSEGIPNDHVRFTTDGTAVHWLDVRAGVGLQAGSLVATVYRADVASGALATVLEQPHLGVMISPHATKLAYRRPGDVPVALYVADADGSDPMLVTSFPGDGASGLEWRPGD